MFSKEMKVPNNFNQVKILFHNCTINWTAIEKGNLQKVFDFITSFGSVVQLLSCVRKKKRD